MSFLFVDRILRMDEGRFIQGIKQVTLSDSYLLPSCTQEGSFFLMPSIIGETLGQLGAWCAMHALEFKVRPVAGVVAAVHIHDEAKIGDTILLETTVDALDETAIEYHSVALVNDKPVFTIESALGPMLPMEDFIDPAEAKRQFDKIYRLGDAPALQTYSSAKSIVKAADFRQVHIDFDKILDYVAGERVVAQKSLSLSAPYLSDHFPRKPVLPLTILLQAKLQLAASFLKRSFEDGQDFKPVTVRKIKMSGFVQPGDTVVTTLQLKEKTENEISITYRTELEGKRVCMAEAIFRK